MLFRSTSAPYYTFGNSLTISPDGFFEYKKPNIKLPDGAKTVIKKDKYGISFIFKTDKSDLIHQSVCVIPNIKDVQIVGDKVVIVLFSDGTSEKAVLDKADTYSLEQGISICITKKMLSAKTEGNGTSAYNKLIRHCVKVYEKNRKAEKKAKADEQEKKDNEKKAAEKVRAKKIKRANEKREREIEIQKEAYLRAMREFGGNSAVKE